MFKRCKVVMLPTNNKSKLFIGKISGQLQTLAIPDKDSTTSTQHLYILSDDEINDGDWIFVDYYHRTEDHKDKGIWKYMKTPCPTPYWGNTRFAKKVIATTDSSLNLPFPSQSFIDKYVEEYNKGNKIEYVMVEYESDGLFMVFDMESGADCSDYKLKINPKDNTITIRKIKDSWNRDEVITLLWNAFKQGESETRHKEFETWINNNL